MTDEHPDIEFRPVPSGTLTTFLHDNLVEALDLRERERIEGAVDVSGLPPDEARAFLERLAAASAATAAYMDGRASEDVFSFHASHTRLARGPAEIADHERRAADALATAARRYAFAVRANPRDGIVVDRWRNLESIRLLNEGRAHMRRGNLDEAERAYRGAVEVEAPWNADEPWTGLGRALLRQGKPAAARDALERAVEIYSGNRDAQALLGEALVALGRPGDARECFDAAYEGGSGPADEDPATLAARAVAEKAERPRGGRSVPAPAASESRAILAEALDAAAGPRGPERDRAVAVLRGARGDAAAVLDGLIAPIRGTARDPAQPAAERVRALSILAAAADPSLAATAREVARGSASDASLAAAAVDAAAEGGDPAVLGGFLDAAAGFPPAVRSRALDRLAAIRDARAVDAVVAALDDPDLHVRTAAFAALFRLMDRKDFDPSAPEADRRAAVERLRAWWTGARAGWR